MSTSCKIHNVKFYDYEIKPIHCLALNKDANWLAVSRKDASIEIWDVKDTPCIIRTIQGTESGSIEAMCWVKNCLLSTGLSGAVVQWDLRTLSIVQSILVTGEAAWCIDVNSSGSTIVVGTELGFINLFSMSDGQLVYDKLFDKQEGRILCCKFDPSGQLLVTGSIETIRVWNVSTGQALHRMTTGRAQKKTETIVWSLAVTKDLTIISGDSRGHLTFWDAKQGDQIDSVATHKGDILAIALSDDEQKLFCTGVDPIIVSFMKVKLKHKGEDKPVEKWVKNIQRNIHQHDVRALVLHNNKLFSAGVDSYLALSSYPPKVLVKYPSVISNSLIEYSQKEKLVLMKYTSRVEIWKLGVPLSDEHGKTSYMVQEDEDSIHENEKNTLTNGEMESFVNKKETSKVTKKLKLSENPQLLLKLTTSGSTPLTCCTMSPNCRWIAYSTDTKFKIFKFSNENNTPALTKVVPLPDDCTPCYQMAFLPDSKTLLTSSADGQIKIIHIHDDGAITAGSAIDTRDVLKSKMLTKLHVSDFYRGKSCYIVASDAKNNIGIWSFSTKDILSSPSFLASPPKYSSQLSAMCVNHHNNTLLLAYADQKVVEYDIVEKCFTQFSKNLNNGGLGYKWFSRQFPITRIDVHPQNKNAYLLQDDTGMYILSQTSPKNKTPPSKKSKTNNETSQEKLWYIIKKMRHLISAGWLSEDEIVVVPVEQDSLIGKMPPCFARKRFGIM